VRDQRRARPGPLPSCGRTRPRLRSAWGAPYNAPRHPQGAPRAVHQQGVTREPAAVDGDLNRLEHDLDSFDPRVRERSLRELAGAVQERRLALPEPGPRANLHCHTFFSYNAYGYSPSHIAWLAAKAGLAVVGIVDFDVLDGVDEFLGAGRLLNLRACAGMETRVFIPEFAPYVINSPGEPGISYHMAVGLPSADLDAEQQRFAAGLRATAQQRNRELVARVNEFLAPVTLDYDRDVIPLTPSGNATERHICLAYARRAQELFGNGPRLVEFWSEKLGTDAAALDLPLGVTLQQHIRQRTMKRGGVGYVQPDTGSFPRLADANRFILAAGGIPTHTWLDGTSEGEARIEELLHIVMQSGVCAINIIPDRNYTRGVADEKLRNLHAVVAVAKTMDLVIVVGTEMNAPGQKFVDDFDSAELAPLAPAFLAGAHIVYAHSVLQRRAGLGYTSRWASARLPSRAERNEFFGLLGERLRPHNEAALDGIDGDMTPDAILHRLD